MKIHLTYPSTHSDAEIDYLFIRYVTEFPAEYAEWQRLERLGRGMGEDGLAETQRQGIDFLKANTSWDGDMALTSAWFAMRMKVVGSTRAH